MYTHGTLARLFHAQARARKVPTGDPRNYPDKWKNIAFKEYPRLPQIELIQTQAKLKSLDQLLQERRSVRTYDPNEQINLQELSTLLYYSCGIKKDSVLSAVAEKNWDSTRRFYPSGGGLYPLEVYVCLEKTIDIEGGTYHYNVKQHVLEKLLGEESIQLFRDALLYKWAKSSPAMIIITGVWHRNLDKYRDFGYREVLLEAGYMGQNIQLVGQSLGLNTCPIIGLDNEMMEKTLDIQNEDESLLCVTMLGK